MKTKRKLPVIIAAFVVVLLAVIAFLLTRGGEVIVNTPTLTIETPHKFSASQRDEFTLDVSISALGEAVYPAMSMSISFDPAYLEFVGVEEGNVFVTDTSSSTGRALPTWSCNPEQCNKSGLINIMYLDLTGGKAAFSRELLAEEDNVLLRLNFRLRGSARNGDIYGLNFADAVFAASDENQSLAMTRNTLKVKDSKIVIGE